MKRADQKSSSRSSFFNQKCICRNDVAITSCVSDKTRQTSFEETASRQALPRPRDIQATADEGWSPMFVTSCDSSTSAHTTANMESAAAPSSAAMAEIPAKMATPARSVVVCATQFACSWDIAKNVRTAESLVREAVTKHHANIVLLQELFAAPYFCQTVVDTNEVERNFSLAASADPKQNPFLRKFQELAKELQVVLPISFFERCNNAHYNSLVVFDADGSLLGLYRKTHIPDSPGYYEKFYFSPGDTGFKVCYSLLFTFLFMSSVSVFVLMCVVVLSALRLVFFAFVSR